MYRVSWDERSLISNDVKDLFGLDDDQDESTSNRKDTLPSRVKNDEADVVRLVICNK